MEHNLVGSPLEALQNAFRELTAKIEANQITLDEALVQLQSKEAVDAAGNTWRIDPITQSFVRRAPGADSTWKQAGPSEFVLHVQPSPQPAVPPVTGDPMGPPVQYGLGGQPVPPRSEGASGPKRRWPIYAGAGAAAVVIGVVAVVALSSQGGGKPSPGPVPTRTAIAQPASPNPRTSPSDSSTPRSSSPPGQQPTAGPTGPQSSGSTTPSEPVYDAVVSEVTSGDVARISRVTEGSQYSPTTQRFFAATFGGWADFGLKIQAEPPVGDSSGHNATQVWDLLSHGDVIAKATVTWHRASNTGPWLLTKWPEFQPTH